MKSCLVYYVCKTKCGMMAADSELTKQLSSHTLSFYSTTLENSRKFTINSNKLGKIGIKLEQVVSKAS